MNTDQEIKAEARNKLSVEESFAKLDEILSAMENDDSIGLEESFKLYDEGLKLIKSVSESIDKVEKQIEILESGQGKGES